MTLVSSWPLGPASLRYILPPFAQGLLAEDARSQDCYPLAMGYYDRALGHRMQRSAQEHEDHLLLYCVQGLGRLRLARQVIPVRPGMLVLLPAGQAHAYEADDAQPWSLYWAHAAGARVPDFLHPLLAGQPCALLAPGVQPALMADWRALLDTRSPGFEPAALQLAAARLRQLLAHLALVAGRSPGPRSRLDVAALQQFMQARLAEPLSLAVLAAQAGMERFHFAKTFRRLTGQSPLQHFLHLRMHRACEWLDEGEGRIGEIAQRLGYDDAAYFSRQFREVIGMSPSAYRALKRG